MYGCVFPNLCSLWNLDVLSVSWIVNKRLQVIILFILLLRFTYRIFTVQFNALEIKIHPSFSMEELIFSIRILTLWNIKMSSFTCKHSHWRAFFGDFINIYFDFSFRVRNFFHFISVRSTLYRAHTSIYEYIVNYTLLFKQLNFGIFNNIVMVCICKLVKFLCHLC